MRNRKFDISKKESTLQGIVIKATTKGSGCIVDILESSGGIVYDAKATTVFTKNDSVQFTYDKNGDAIVIGGGGSTTTTKKGTISNWMFINGSY